MDQFEQAKDEIAQTALYLTEADEINRRSEEYKTNWNYNTGLGLGAGSEGNCVRLRHLETFDPVVAKNMRQEVDAATRRHTMPHEVRNLFLLNTIGTGPGHDTIIKALDWYPCTPNKETSVLLLENCEMGDLCDYMVKKHGETGSGWRAPHEGFVRHVFLQLAEGLAFLHAGYNTSLFDPATRTITRGRPAFAHRDIKPNNVLLTRDAGSRAADPRTLPRLKLGDFGGAIELPPYARDHRVPPERALYKRTEDYRAPEYFARGAARPPPAAGEDVFAMGATVHWCMFGCSVWNEQVQGLYQRRRINRQVHSGGHRYSDDLGEMVARATARDPAHRPSALQFVDVLRRDYDAWVDEYLGYKARGPVMMSAMAIVNEENEDWEEEWELGDPDSDEDMM